MEGVFVFIYSTKHTFEVIDYIYWLMKWMSSPGISDMILPHRNKAEMGYRNQNKMLWENASLGSNIWLYCFFKKGMYKWLEQKLTDDHW